MQKSKGFTLIELLVVISVISIISVIGLVSFQNIRQKTLEGQRVANINAIQKAYEAKYDPGANNGQGGYKAVTDTDFANGKMPKAPDGSSYILPPVSTNTDGSIPNFVACVNKNDGSACFAQSNVCYCKISNQGIPVTLLQNNAASCDPSGNLLKDLAGYWKFDEGVSTTTADYTRNGADASVNGPTWENTSVNGSFGKALRFDGIDDYVLAPQNSVLNNITNHTSTFSSFTLSLWVKPTSLNWSGLLQKNWQWLVSGGNGCLRNGGIQPSCTYINVPTALNSWTNIVLTYNPVGGSNNLKAYTQGVFSESKTSTGNPDNIADLVIGGPGGNSYFSGLIDDVRVYNRALSVAEVTTLYNGGNGCIP